MCWASVNLMVTVRGWCLFTAHWQKEDPEELCQTHLWDINLMWQLMLMISCDLGMWFRSGHSKMTRLEKNWELGTKHRFVVAFEAVWRWSSLLEGVFSRTVQQDMAGLQCQHIFNIARLQNNYNISSFWFCHLISLIIGSTPQLCGWIVAVKWVWYALSFTQT